MEVKHKQAGGKGKFYIEIDGRELGEMVYTMAAADKMIIEHTEVNEELKGQNAGLKMVNQAVEYARENHIKIIPLCPFAKSVFDRKKELGDVLFKPA